MLKMSTVHVIRHKVLVEKASQRQVAEQLGISRNTVAKYLEVSEPRHAPYGPRRKPVTDLVKPRLEALLEEWAPRTTPKQRITAKRLLRQLREEGFEVGVTTVADFLREWRRARAEVFIPLSYRPGDVAQVDFFEVTVELDGVLTKVWKFLMRLMYSGYDFAWLYERCDQVAFFDGHVRAFAYFQAVPARAVYDNLAPAVHFRLGLTGERERQLSDRFAALCSHYLVEPCFTRVGEGHDKGGVESRGRGIRLQHLVPVPRGATLAEMAQALLDELAHSAAERRDAHGRSPRELFALEQPSLRPLPAAPFDPSRFVPVSISSKATVQIDGVTYSVPSTWARLDASAWVGVDTIRVACRGEVRSFTKAAPGERQIRYRDYLPELARKPQAVRQVAPELLSELGEVWGQLWALLVATHGEREASRVLARLLGLVVSAGEAPVTEQLEAALAGPAPDVRVLARLVHGEEAVREISVPDALASYQVEAARACDYDWLLAGGAK
jgi:transposase